MLGTHVFVFTGSLFSANLGQVLDLMGASCGSAICLVFPALFYIIQSRYTDRFAPLGQTTSKYNTCTPLYIAAWVMVVMGVFVGIIATFLTLYLPHI
mmetsp:Transcript_32477/g.70958  ORF Transcript_32477/g.70958 Transcript_32477/m.70958 type:complete len:97 (+) Transcript_32477:586-876(+)